MIYIPETFNTNISHQPFDYAITFVNSQHYRTQIQKVRKNGFKYTFKYFWFTKINLYQIAFS